MENITFTLKGGVNDSIQLIQLLKATNCVFSGSEAQEVVAMGMVKLNGKVELRKRAQLSIGDVVEYEQTRIEIKA